MGYMMREDVFKTMRRTQMGTMFTTAASTINFFFENIRHRRGGPSPFFVARTATGKLQALLAQVSLWCQGEADHRYFPKPYLQIYCKGACCGEEFVGL